MRIYIEACSFTSIFTDTSLFLVQKYSAMSLLSSLQKNPQRDVIQLNTSWHLHLYNVELNYTIQNVQSETLSFSEISSIERGNSSQSLE